VAVSEDLTYTKHAGQVM